MDITDAGSSSLLNTLLQQAVNESTPPASIAPTSPSPIATDSIELSPEARILQQALAPLVQSILQDAGSDSGTSALLTASVPDALLTSSLSGSNPGSDSESLLAEALLAGTTMDGSGVINQSIQATDQTGSGGIDGTSAL